MIFKLLPQWFVSVFKMAEATEGTKCAVWLFLEFSRKLQSNIPLRDRKNK